MTFSLDLLTGMRCAAGIAAIGIVWDAVELLLHRDTLDRFFEWPVIRSRYYILLRHKGLGALFDVVLTGRLFLVLVAAHALAAVAFAVLLPIGRPFVALLALFVLAVHCAIHLRLLVGMDGADQMQSIVWAGLGIYALDLGPIANWAAAIFIVVELMLSYAVAGIAKLVSPGWRRGTAIASITRTGTYCSPGMSTALQLRPVSLAVGWATIGFELLAPMLLFGGHPGLALFVAAGAAFHIGIAMTMGLSTFVFAFLAAYPVLCAVVLAL
jgi:hypothetical protein